MRVLILTTVVMFAFAANSVLTRLALAEAVIGPSAFALVRLAAGAGMLTLLVLRKQRRLAVVTEISIWSVLSLSAYVLGFSYAYVSLETGAGALILFGGVQVTMILGALIAGERPGIWRWIGAALAFGGLVYLLAPSARAPDPFGAALMLVAAIGWGGYSLLGRRVARPLSATAANFLLSVPLGLAAFVLLADSVPASPEGITLAMVSGAATSGLGYALWYAVLPRLAASMAAIAQLTVPIIASGGGILLLGESLSAQFVIASVLVLGGVGISIRN
ncbi:MAG: DMT family transporter [Paracoccaceae bacterium]